MSQPPYPFQPQQFQPDDSQYQPFADSLAPARRAGVMLIVIGAMAIAMGGCAGIMGLLVPFDQVIAQAHIDLSQLPPGVAPATYMKISCIISAVICVPLGIFMIVSGIFARRGARWALISGIVVCALPMLYLAFDGVIAVGKGMVTPQMLGGALCVVVVPMVLFGLALIWLVQAIRQQPQVQYAQQQYQMQMWQYQQQQQASQQQLPPMPPPALNDPWQRGYGMTPPPPPPPNLPPPPAV